jgi:hypothetical protein
LTLGFVNHLVLVSNQGSRDRPADGIGQFTRAASARREVMSSFM